MMSSVRRGMLAAIPVLSVVVLLLVWTEGIENAQFVSLSFVLLAALLAVVPTWRVGNQAESGFVGWPARSAAFVVLGTQVLVAIVFLVVWRDAVRAAVSVHAVTMLIGVALVWALIGQARSIVETTRSQRSDTAVITGSADRLAYCIDAAENLGCGQPVREAAEALRYTSISGNLGTREFESSIKDNVALVEAGVASAEPRIVADSAKKVVWLVRQRELAIRASR